MKKYIGIWSCLLCMVFVGTLEAKVLHINASQARSTRQIENLAPFTQLYVAGKTEVEFIQTDEEQYGVSISGPDNLIPLMDISSNAETLYIKYKEPVVITGEDDVHISVMAPALTSIEAASFSEVKIPGKLLSTDLSLKTAGKAEIDISEAELTSLRLHTEGDSEINIENLSCDYLQAAALHNSSLDVDRTACKMILVQSSDRAKIEIAGITAENVQAQSINSGDIKLKGSTQTASLTARNRSGIHAGAFRAERAEVMAENSAYIDVRVEDTLNAQTQGRGKVEYRGWPKEVNRIGKEKSIYPAR